jgi:hypothetical protein
MSAEPEVDLYPALTDAVFSLMNVQAVLQLLQNANLPNVPEVIEGALRIMQGEVENTLKGIDL